MRPFAFAFWSHSGTISSRNLGSHIQTDILLRLFFRCDIRKRNITSISVRSIWRGHFQLDKRDQFRLDSGDQFDLDRRGQMVPDFPFCPCLWFMSNKNSVNSLKEEFFIGNVSPKSILIQFLVKGFYLPILLLYFLQPHFLCYICIRKNNRNDDKLCSYRLWNSQRQTYQRMQCWGCHRKGRKNNE